VGVKCFPLISLSSDTPGIQGVQDMSENTPNLGSVFPPGTLAIPENPVKLPFSVRVENTLKSRSFCQNTAEMHLIKCTPEALKSR